MSESPLQIGEVIAGKYRIERQIGRGGMGIVLAATHLQLEHLVAIKVMRCDSPEDGMALDRLLLEARSAAKIRSEHVARVLDIGTLDNGSAFIVMEYLEGEDLADLLDREGAIDVELAVSFMLQVCEALAEVHAGEMVHRDLKPGNLFVARLPDGSPTLKLVDFGISKYIGGSASERALAHSPQVLGSPFYMAPEQMRAEAVDERSDIWGLGAILFEMLTGRAPFVGESLPEIYAAVLGESPPPIDALRPGIPPGLDDVVQRCLEKDPAQRFCDVADLAEALAPFGGSTSAQSVERITRILTNPEPFRSRPSLIPLAAPSLAAGVAVPRASSPPTVNALVEKAAAVAPEVPALSDGADPLRPSRAVVEGVASAHDHRVRKSGPVTADGAARHRATRRWAWAAVTLAAVASLAAALWFRPEPLPSAEATRGASSAVSAPPTLAAEPDESSPTAKKPSDIEASADAPGESVVQPASLSVEKPALRPAPAAATPAALPAARGGAKAIKQGVARPLPPSERRRESEPAAPVVEPPADEPNAESPRAESNEGARRMGSEDPIDDPWNPRSFGERR